MTETEDSLFQIFKSECKKEGIHLSDEEFIQAFAECQFFETHGINRLDALIQMNKRLEHFISKLSNESDKK